MSRLGKLMHYRMLKTGYCKMVKNGCEPDFPKLARAMRSTVQEANNLRPHLERVYHGESHADPELLFWMAIAFSVATPSETFVSNLTLTIFKGLLEVWGEDMIPVWALKATQKKVAWEQGRVKVIVTNG